jgi:hypothetical protein
MEEATSKVQKKLEELRLPQRQLVIIPNHIHVPESERTKLSVPESDKSSTPVSEASQDVEETVEEEASRFELTCFDIY